MKNQGKATITLTFAVLATTIVRCSAMAFTCNPSDHLGSGCDAAAYPLGTYAGLYCRKATCPTNDDKGHTFNRKQYHCLVRVFKVCPPTGNAKKTAAKETEKQRVKPQVEVVMPTVVAVNSDALSSGGNFSDANKSSTSSNKDKWLVTQAAEGNVTETEIALSWFQQTTISIGSTLAIVIMAVAVGLGLAIGLRNRRRKLAKNREQGLIPHPGKVFNKAEGPLENLINY